MAFTKHIKSFKNTQVRILQVEVVSITWSNTDPSAGPTSFIASSKICSLFPFSNFKTSISMIPNTGRWSDCLSSARPYQNTEPASY